MGLKQALSLYLASKLEMYMLVLSYYTHQLSLDWNQPTSIQAGSSVQVIMGNKWLDAVVVKSCQLGMSWVVGSKP